MDQDHEIIGENDGGCKDLRAVEKVVPSCEACENVAEVRRGTRWPKQEVR